MNIVYALMDPLTFEAKYIGITRNSLNARLSNHCSKGSVAVSKWVKDLISYGAKPEIIALEEEITDDCAYDAETFWLQYMRNIGCDLLNVHFESQNKRVRLLKPVKERKCAHNSNHGGFRKGAGSPKGQRKEDDNIASCRLEIRMSKLEKQMFKELSVARNMTIAEYIKLMCLSGKEDCDV